MASSRMDHFHGKLWQSNLVYTQNEVVPGLSCFQYELSSAFRSDSAWTVLQHLRSDLVAGERSNYTCDHAKWNIMGNTTFKCKLEFGVVALLFVETDRNRMCVAWGEGKKYIELMKESVYILNNGMAGGVVFESNAKLEMVFVSNLDGAMSMELKAATLLENQYVHSVYENIAEHFSHTRHHPWPSVSAFLNNLPEYSVVGDIGCGNGKYGSVNKSISMFATDISPRLLHARHDKSKEAFVSDALLVPIRSGLFDAVISIAVLHHFSTVERRLTMIRELVRLTRIGGSIFLVAWALEQDTKSKRKFESQDNYVEWKLQNKYLCDDLPKFDTVRCEKKQWTVFKRFCHVYRRNEIINLVEQIPQVEIISVQYDQSNWCLQIRRTE